MYILLPALVCAGVALFTRGVTLGGLPQALLGLALCTAWAVLSWVREGQIEETERALERALRDRDWYQAQMREEAAMRRYLQSTVVRLRQLLRRVFPYRDEG
jgi:hypothetical protein